MQSALFYESYFDALRDDVQALGGAKVVGAWFWPEKSVEAARNKLNDALNPDRRDRLTDEQEHLLMRRAREARGFSAALCFVCDATGFERPKAIAPADKQAQLQRDVVAAVATLERITHELRINHMLPEAAVRVVR